MGFWIFSIFNARIRIMTGIQYIIKGLKNFANFKGRASHRECFIFYFFVFLTMGFSLGLDKAMGWEFENVVDWMAWYPTFETARLLLLVPGLAVTARRLHDADKSGWYCLLFFIPIIGWAYLLSMLLLDGNPDKNRHGPPVVEHWPTAHRKEPVT